LPQRQKIVSMSTKPLRILLSPMFVGERTI
jgi:hypothetical protein